MNGSRTADEPERLALWSTLYEPANRAHDEVFDATGALRPAWAEFLHGMDDVTPEGLGQRAEQARRLLRENGVTYNSYGAPQGPNRPWELDPLPLLFTEAEWQPLASALSQRARLLNRVLSDLYGPQELVRLGLLPAELVFGHASYLYACQGVRPPEDVYLHLYAAHLARHADGRWITLADRTQGPSGAGFAVENRIVISRTLPHDFTRLHVERLAGFFITLRETLRSMSPRRSETPRIVLLSPGPRSATYFEDTYLARYLGYTLAEGGDLTVRGAEVFLKTLGGLAPVDVILRRVLDEDCDPLEFKPDAVHGVPGLMQAVRSGHVTVANALGSGWLESPALMAFLPEIAKYYGEELRLPSVPTWWCGRPRDLQYVESNLDQLVIRPAMLQRTAKPIVVSQLSHTQRTELWDRIRDRPGEFVAQEHVTRSTIPVWSGGRLQPWHVGMRAFAVADGDGYQIMPGGLSRVSSTPQGLGEGMAAGQGSKDVWILAAGPVAKATLLPVDAKTVELIRSVNDLPSRVADNLFWIGRLVERAEGMVRHLRSAVVRMTSDFEPSGVPELVRIVYALIDPSDTPLARSEDDNEEALVRLTPEILSFVFDPARTESLRATLDAVREVSLTVRDRLSIDSWRIINQLDIDSCFPWRADRARLSDAGLLFNQLLNLLAAFSGLAMESMTRGPGWRFLDMGRRIERSLHTLRLLRRTVVRTTPDEIMLLEMLLEIADSTMTYRYRYRASLQLAPMLDLLVFDDSNPRGIAFQLAALADHVRRLPSDSSYDSLAADQTLVRGMRGSLRLTDVDAWCETNQSGHRPLLDHALRRMTDQLAQLSDTLTSAYLTHTEPAHSLVSAPRPSRP